MQTRGGGDGCSSSVEHGGQGESLVPSYTRTWKRLSSSLIVGRASDCAQQLSYLVVGGDAGGVGLDVRLQELLRNAITLVFVARLLALGIGAQVEIESKV